MRILPIIVVLVAPRLAAAGELRCELAEPGVVTVDGMLDDWDGIAPARAGGKDADASFDVRCSYDGKKLAIAIDVRDDKLIRIPKAKGKKLLADDRLEVKLAATGKAQTFVLFPGTERTAPRRVKSTYKGKKVPRWLVVEDTQQPSGWSLELELPLAKLGGWSAATATLSASITFHDGDSRTAKKTQESVATALTLSLGDSAQLYERFLKDLRLKAKDVVLDEMADVDPSTPGAERVVVAGMVIGVLAEQYAYAELPVLGVKDVLGVQLVDLRGDGTRQVLARVRQDGSGGKRDLLIAYGGTDQGLGQLFAIEIRKQMGQNVLESGWSVVKAGTRRKLKKKQKAKGQELVVEAKPAVGWTEDSFAEFAADDAEPIHQPWAKDRAGSVYWLEDGNLRSQALKSEN